MKQAPELYTDVEPIIYNPEPTPRAFHACNKFYRAIMGPIGSGSSTACVMELFTRAREQEPYNNVRRTRHAIIRNCYDDQTEILTETRGFQLFKNLLPNDKVATLQEGKLVYELPDGVSVSDYNGEMIGFESESVDFLVTPDHQMWVSRAHGRKKLFDDFHMEYAQDVYERGRNYPRYRVRKDADWDGEHDDCYSVRQFEFLGYWFAAGMASVYSQGRRHWTLTTTDDIEYVHELLISCEIPYRIAKRSDGGLNFYIEIAWDDWLFGELLQCGRAASKKVPFWMKNAPKAHLNAFLRGFRKGDGSTRREGTVTLYTSSKVLADDLQEIALKAGRAANIHSRDRRGKKVKIGEAEGKINSIEYIVTILGKKKHRPYLYVIPKNTNHLRGWYKQHYEGKVYCAEMSIPTVYVRRNGKTFWCNRTYPELISTSMNTWKDWVPESICPISMATPITGRMQMPLSDGTLMDMEIIFLALDKDDDVRKLKSLELTMAWINEASEISQNVVRMAGGRVDRFPPKRQGGATFAGVILDTNPPDEDSWYYMLSEIEKPETYAFFKQPPALLPLPKQDPNAPQLYVPNQGQGQYPPAENISNHTSGFEYYMRQVHGASEEWIKVFLMGQYGTISDGKPVYSEYNDSIHCATEEITVYRGLPIILSWDYGMTPACVISQLSPRGQFRVIDELVSGIPEAQRLNMDPIRYVGDMGIRQFSRTIVKPYLINNYPGISFHSVGDPAGNERGQSNEITCMQELSWAGIPTEMGRTNKFIARREAVAGFLNRMVDGNPGFLLSPRCRMLRKGFNGHYRYRMMRVQTGEKYTNEPEKNIYSHCHDGLQYGAMYAEGGGGGEGVTLTGEASAAKPIQQVDSGGWT